MAWARAHTRGRSEDPEGAARPFDPVEHVAASRRGPRTARTLFSVGASAIRLARGASPRLFTAVALIQLAIAGLLGVQVLFGKLALDAILQAEDSGAKVTDALPALIALVTTGAVSSVASAFQAQGQRLLGEAVQQRTLAAMLQVTTSVDLETFESPVFFDDLQRVQTSALTQPLTLAQGLLQTLGGILSVIGLSVAIASIEPLLLPILLTASLPLWVLSRRQGGLEFRFNVRQTAGARFRFYLVAVLTGREEAKELRAFDIGHHLQRRWSESYGEYLSALRVHVRRRLILALLGALVTVVVTCGAFSLLISFVVSDRLSLAAAGASVLAIRLLAGRISSVFTGIGALFESSLFLDDFARFTSRTTEESRRRPSKEGTTVTTRSGIELTDVRFAYPESDVEAVSGVTMRIDRNEVVALVGENGSGKTTLAKLIGALFTPTHGRIAWDGVDISTLERRELRRRIGIIFQDFVRYELSARENVGLGRSEAADDLDGIATAARRAGADTFLESLPEGYATVLGKTFSGGHDLSLGQWQRVALARAFYRDPELLILDEPTASLDARSEHQLFEYVAELGRDRSVLLISHRFSTVKSADRIYVLHEGRIVEEGSHNDLMSAGGRYAELFELQAGAYR